MPRSCCVDILLATYNGANNLGSQIDSILEQSHENFRLIIRDDSSSDCTLEIISNYNDSRIILVQDGFGNVGVSENFKILLKHATSEYVMFSDQDDVWFPEKIAKMLSFIVNIDSGQIPCLAYSSGIVVDSKLQPFKNVKHTAYQPISSLESGFFLNGGVQGCAMIFNKKLYTSVLDQDFNWYLHDQAITLFALCFGRVYFYNEPLFYYRQHSFNVVGFKKQSLLKTILKYLFEKEESFLVKSSVRDSVRSFYNTYGQSLSIEKRNSMQDYLSIENGKVVDFLYSCGKHGWDLNGSKIRLLVKALLCKRFVE